MIHYMMTGGGLGFAVFLVVIKAIFEKFLCN